MKGLKIMNEKLQEQYDEIRTEIYEFYSDEDGYTHEDGFNFFERTTSMLVDIVEQLKGD